MIVVNVQKLNDLKNGNAYTNPTFLGMDQKMLDDLGVALMFVNLAILAKHGLNKAADKLINSKNMSALDSNWTAWKQQAKTNLNKTAGNITDYASDTLNRAKNRLPGSKLAMDGSPHVSFSKPTKPLPQNSRQQNFWKETEAGKGDLARKLDGGTGQYNKSELYDKNGKYTGGRTQEELDDLATDPDRGHVLDDQGRKEREVGLAVEERGDLGKIKRDSGGAEFYDELSPNKQRWDVKSYESFPNGHTDPKKGAFSVKTTLKNMYKKLNKDIYIIIDTRELIPEHIEQLKEAIVKEGLVDKVIWYP